MKQIAQLIVVFLLMTVLAPICAGGNRDDIREFKSNFWYGTNDGMSPDYRRAIQFFHETVDQGKRLVKRLIGVGTYNKIAGTLDNFAESVEKFFSQPWGRRFEWKPQRQTG